MDGPKQGLGFRVEGLRALVNHAEVLLKSMHMFKTSRLGKANVTSTRLRSLAMPNKSPKPYECNNNLSRLRSQAFAAASVSQAIGSK